MTIRAEERWKYGTKGHWQPAISNWMKTKGSLTKRLVRLNKGFEVEPVWQARASLRAVEARWLGVRPGQRVDVRLVRLRVGGKPVVVAKTIKLLNSPRCDWPFWRGLGKRSLGSALFSDPRVKRGNVKYCEMPKQCEWVEALGGLNCSRYARMAKFSVRSETTPLWVCEVFLSTLVEVSAQ